MNFRLIHAVCHCCPHRLQSVRFAHNLATNFVYEKNLARPMKRMSSVEECPYKILS